MAETAIGQMGAKTAGVGGGAVAAVALAGAATTVSMRWLGFTVPPDIYEAACQTLVYGFWWTALGAIGLMGGLIGGFFWRRAQRRWGSREKTPTV